MKKTVSGLPIGIYHVTGGNIYMGHAVALIKIDQNLCFIFNPTCGLIKCEGESGYHNMESCFKYLKKPDSTLEITFNQRDRGS